ncbi:MAG: DNA (cytosine-5-)-methyltransferase [Treponemataceae bacterium]|nr:DNA (cytosine-5-)-methyltransferase [Treponemataceae bacterium]
MGDKSFTFIDLFAGIGGFHLAMKKLGGRCVFASEIKPELQQFYEKNFKMKCAGDINKVDIEKDILPYQPQVLCAGFPCQPFSKAGKQQGFDDDKERGNLFYKIMEILKKCKPEYVFIENVPNLKSHDGGNTYKVISAQLSELYDIRDEIISPHYFGIPQHRTRIYIVGRLIDKGGLRGFSFPPYKKSTKCSIEDIIDKNDTVYMTLKPQTRIHMQVWQEFLDLLTAHDIPIPTFPVWAMEWGADYKYETVAPFYQHTKSLEGKKGKFGCHVQGNSKDDLLGCLPIYAQTNKTEKNHNFPDWKKNFIKWNREFYQAHKQILDPWLEKLKQHGFKNSHQKFEWNCGHDKGVKHTLYDKIVQFRPSGIRVKLPTYSPALVLTTTQIPIFPWVETPNGEKGRYMTSKEAAKLQCMGDLEYYPDTVAEAFRAFGNAINVEVVRRIAERLLEIE